MLKIACHDIDALKRYVKLSVFLLIPGNPNNDPI